MQREECRLFGTDFGGEHRGKIAEEFSKKAKTMSKENAISLRLQRTGKLLLR